MMDFSTSAFNGIDFASKKTSGHLANIGHLRGHLVLIILLAHLGGRFVFNP